MRREYEAVPAVPTMLMLKLAVSAANDAAA
jgi:hypothetical protein